MTNMHDRRPFSALFTRHQGTAAFSRQTVPPDDDFEEHLIDLLGAIATMQLVSRFDSQEGAYLIARIHDHADALRRAYYRSDERND